MGGAYSCHCCSTVSSGLVSEIRNENADPAAGYSAYIRQRLVFKFIRACHRRGGGGEQNGPFVTLMCFEQICVAPVTAADNDSGTEKAEHVVA